MTLGTEPLGTGVLGAEEAVGATSTPKGVFSRPLSRPFRGAFGAILVAITLLWVI